MELEGEVKICHWRKIVELGSGRTGSVSLCIERSCPGDKSCGEINQRVFHAVKRVPRKCMTNSGAVRRVMREKEALKQLKGHHGIVELRFTSKDADSLYFVLEPLVGGPLHRHIRGGPGGHFEVPVAKFYSSEMTSAIAHMHSHGFVHRDIKASNIVLSSTGHAKLVDMGCCKRLERLRSNSTGDVGTTCNGSCEKTYTYCGTPHSMAPEMVSRTGHGLAVDWWSLGILIHEMLNGEPPFGYKADDLPQRITAGLPREKICGEDALVQTNGGPAASGIPRQKDTGGEGADEAVFLSIVRQLLDTDPARRLGSSRGGDEVMCHAWFEGVNWKRIAKLETEPPAFRRDVGELEYLEGESGRKNGIAQDVDPEGLFAGF